LGVEAGAAGEVVVGEALVGEVLVATPSTAHACAPHNAPAAARIIVAKMRSFVMREPPWLNMGDRETVKSQLQGTGCHAQPEPKNSGLVAVAPQWSCRSKSGLVPGHLGYAAEMARAEQTKVYGLRSLAYPANRRYSSSNLALSPSL
jgi:hypothetical protein